MRAHFPSSKIRLSFAALSVLVVGAALALPARSAPGDLDPAFGTGGFTIVKQGEAYRVGRSVVVQPDGKYLVGALAWGWENYASPLQRFNADHSVDTAFGYQGQAMVQGLVTSAVMSGSQPMTAEMAYAYAFDETLLVEYREIYVVKYLATGFPDTSFGINGRTPAFNAGVGGEQRLSVMTVAPDGKIVAAGWTQGPLGATQLLIVRFTASGALDTSFGTGGWLAFGMADTTAAQEINGIAVQADGRILISGFYDSPRKGFLSRLHADGSDLDAAFGATGVVPIGSGLGPVECGGLLQVSPTRIAVGCTHPVGGGNDHAVVRAYTDTGAIDLGFTATPIDMGNNEDKFRALAMAGDGKIYAAGYGGAGRIAVAAFESNGAALAGFGTGGVYTMPESTYSSGWALAVNGGEVIVTGDTEGPDSAVAVVSLDRLTGARVAANYYKNSSSHGFGAVKALPGGKIMTGGTVGLGNSPNYIATRFNADGSIDSSFGTAGRSMLAIPDAGFNIGLRDMAIQPDGKVVMAGDFGGFPTGQIRIGAARLTGAGGDAAFNAGGTPGYNFVNTGASFAANFTRSVRLQSDGKILAAGSGIAGGFRNIAVVRFNTDGTVDSGYGTGGVAMTAYASTTTGRAIDVQADDKVVAVGSAGNSIRVVRFMTSGALDASFGSGGTATFPMPGGYGLSTPNRIFARPSGKTVVVASVIGPTGVGIMAIQFNADGSLDAAFGTGGYGYIESISGPGAQSNAYGAAITPNGKIVAVGIADNAAGGHAMIVRFTAGGQPDASFGANGLRLYDDPFARPELAYVDVMADGSMLLAATYYPGAEHLGLLVKTVADASAVAVAPAARRPADFNGDGRTDLTWIDAGGQAAMWLMNGTSPSGAALLIGPATGWTVARNDGDFNGDGQSDLLWRHTDGSWAIWLMNGFSQIGSTLLLGPGSGWEIIHLADFNNDARTDLVWKDASGQVAFWLMDGLGASSAAVVFPGGTGWNVEHVGDFNGDGSADLLFKDGAGQLAIWLMNGTSATATGLIYGGGAFGITKVADFNGDGRTDLLFTDAGNTVALWLMDGLGATGVGVVASSGAFLITHVGDLDGNGRADLVFRDPAGQVAIWLMDGLTIAGSGIIFGGGGGWNVTHLGDFDGDGRSDLAWKDAGGQVALWTMNGLAPVATAVIFDGSGGWVMAP